VRPAWNGFAPKASSDVPAADAITALTDAFDDPSAPHDHGAESDRQTVVISWPAVPIELVRAAGLRPIVVRGAAAPTPRADAHLEAGVFPSRIRQLIDAVLAGRLSRAAHVVLPRTSDPDYQGFLYLRELARRQIVRQPGSILLFDLLQSQGGEVAVHNAARTRSLFEMLARPGRSAPLDALREQIAHANEARAALRRLLALRRGSPRVTGAEVLPLIGAFWSLAPQTYAPLANAAADSIGGRPPLDRPRVLLLGAPVDGPALHAAIEAHGAVVVAESGPWGLDAAGDDVAGGADPFAAIAEKYSRDASGPRTPVVDTRRRTTQALAGIDAVVVSLPPDDAVSGWDYPWLREQLRARGVPHVCLTHDPCGPVPEVDQERLAALLGAAASRLEAPRG
jgi:hypothetical protein